MRGAAAYRTVNEVSRVEGASPHGLVAILLDEAASQIATIEVAYARGQAAYTAQARAQAILHALDSSLDHVRGGQTAALMARVYREAGRCLMLAAGENDPFWCRKAQMTLQPIAEAWDQIRHAG